MWSSLVEGYKDVVLAQLYQEMQTRRQRWPCLLVAFNIELWSSLVEGYKDVVLAQLYDEMQTRHQRCPCLLVPFNIELRNFLVERDEDVISEQLSNKFDYYPFSIVLAFHKHNSLPLRPISALMGLLYLNHGAL